MSSSSGASTSQDSRATTLFDRASEADGLEGILIQGIGGTFLAMFTALATGILTIGDLVIKPIAAFANAGEEIVNTIFVDVMSGIIGAGAAETIASIRGPFGLGPFSIVLAVGVLLLTWWVIRKYLQEDETSNIIPGLGFDIPFVGTEEEGDERG